MKRKNMAVSLLSGFVALSTIFTVPVSTYAAELVDNHANTHLDGKETTPANSSIQHVIYIVADNIHLSDIQQMPHLMTFLKKGTLFDNDHTILDSHTQDGMISDMTGQYPSKTGVPDQSFFSGGKYSSFLYWNSPDGDGQTHVTTTPPWTAFNQQGKAVGAIGTPDMELESTKEVRTVNPIDTNVKDYLGVAVHNTDGTDSLGSPNIPYVYHAVSWSDPSKTLGGFPGWGNPDPNWPLQATYEMQTHGVPVTFTYLHDVHEVNGKQVGPGQYKSAIDQYDYAFDTFITKLNDAGINSSNTLFVITTDEGDHYCTQGEQDTNLLAWLSQSNPIFNTPASDLNIISDSGALVYEKDPSILNNTLTSLQAVPGWNYIANPTELKTLHVASDKAPTRTPSFILFAKPDVWYTTSGNTDLVGSSDYLWNHGTISPDILQTWLGIVGPGVKTNQVSHEWLDHSDTMPTVYALLGYNFNTPNFDGIPAIDAFDSKVMPLAVKQNQKQLLTASEIYKQLNAPVGTYAMQTLKLSTDASINATNQTGEALNKQIEAATQVRDQIASNLQQAIFQTWSSQVSPAQKGKVDLDDISEKAQMFLQDFTCTEVNTSIEDNSK